MTILNTGIGWHEARVPTIVTSVPRGRLRWRDRPAHGARCRSRSCASNRINTPRARRGDPRRRRGRPGLDGPAAAGRPGVGRQGRGRPRRRDQHLHRLQPGLPRPRVRATSRPPAWSTRAPAARPSWCSARPARAKRGRGRRRRPGRARRRGLSGRARASASTLFEAADEHRRPVPARDARIPGKEEFAETLRYYRRRLEVLGRRRAPRHPGHAPTTSRRTTRSSSPPASTRGCRTIPGIDHPSVLVRTPSVLTARPSRRRPGRGDRRRRHRRRRRRVPAARRRHEPLEDWMAPLGRRRPAAAPGRPHRAQGRAAAARGDAAAAQDHADRRSASARPPAGCTGRCCKQSGVVQVSGATYDRIDDDGLHSPRSTASAADVLEVDHVVLCAGQESVRELYDELVAAAGDHGHLIGGADVAAELDAKRAIEQGTRVAAAPAGGMQARRGSTAGRLRAQAPWLGRGHESGRVGSTRDPRPHRRGGRAGAAGEVGLGRARRAAGLGGRDGLRPGAAGRRRRSRERCAAA